LTGSKFQEFNGSFIDINTKPVLPVFEFKELSTALQWLTMLYIANWIFLNDKKTHYPNNNNFPYNIDILGLDVF